MISIYLKRFNLFKKYTVFLCSSVNEGVLIPKKFCIWKKYFPILVSFVVEEEGVTHKSSVILNESVHVME